MKVLLIGPLPPPHGGISVNVAQMRRELAEAGVACEVLDTRDFRYGLALLRYARQGWTLHLHSNGHNWQSWRLALLCGIAGQGKAGCVLTLHSGIATRYLQASGWRGSVARAICLLYERVNYAGPRLMDNECDWTARSVA